ncbi:MAG: serine hydrolase domain-containing protein, partial [Mycobacterium sp.]
MSKLRCMVGILVALIATTALLVPVGASAAEPTNFAGVRKTLSREIPEIMKDTHTVGLSIALVDGERTVWARGFGSANRAQKVPVTGETLFQIGSTSKSLAAVAVMQLVEQGKVDLDAPLSRYVPQFKMLPRFPGSVVTLRNVLDMHSGIPGDIYNGAATTKPYPGFDNLLLRILAKTYPQRPVNTTWAYSNSGYSLLRNVVENVTGQGFVAYTHQHLFAPMGMNRTTFDPAAAPVGDLAVGYQTATGAKGGVRVETPPRVYLNCWASGSVVSSASEMASYLKTMIAHGVAPEGSRVLARSTLRQMTTPQTHLPLDITSFKAGLGLWVGDSGNRWMGRALYWNGDTPTFHTFFRWLPELGLGVFVSVNTTTTAPVRDEVGLRALGLMVTAKTGRAAPKPAQPAPVVKASPARLRRAAGQYASSAAGLFTVSAVDGHLKLAAQGPLLAHLPPVTLLPRADGWYAAAPPAGEAGLFEMAWYK